MGNNGAFEASQIHVFIPALLNKATRQLAIFFEKVLPSLFDDWWKQAVVNNLSAQQRQRIEQRNIDSLASLDLAALLRVLDQNWYQISTKLRLTSEARHFVKEMQTVRNRWAHAGTDLNNFDRELEELHIALCPLCAAMYKEFVKQVEDAMVSFKNALMNSEEPEVPLQLGELNTSVRFVESHYQDIKTILRAQISDDARHYVKDVR